MATKESSAEEKTNILANLPRSLPVNTRDELAKIETLAETATPEIKTALRTGDLSISAAYEGVKAGATTVDEVEEVSPKLE